MDEQIRAATAETATNEIAAALQAEHRFDLPPAWRDTIRRIVAEHVVVILEEPASDPNAVTARLTRGDVEETDPAELEGNYPRPPAHGGVKRRDDA
jgi:hypothetical protein